MSGYQIKVTLENTKPPVWRRMEIPDRITFCDLHGILQEVFGWKEMHLHGFTFQNTSVSVGEARDSDYDENGLLVDDFLRAGWIRYTYDYGDDWRHKIVLEKELADYAERCSRVVKYKGANFEEDSGGIWGESASDDSGRLPYDLEAVNESLASFVYPEDPKAVTAEEQGIRVSQKREEKEKRDRMFEAMDDFASLIRNAMGKEKLAPIDLLAQQLEEVWYDLMMGDCWEFLDSDKQMSVLLENNGVKHLFELKKYLALPEKIEFPLVRTMAEHVERALKEHPEYLIYTLTRQELELYMDCFRKKKRAQMPEPYILMAFAMWGLVELEIINKRKKPFLHIGIPKDAESIVVFYETTNVEEQIRCTERIWERIDGLLMCYGFMEIQALHEQYSRLFGEIAREEFERCLYLRGSFRKQIITGTRMNKGKKETWAALSEDIAVYVTDMMAEEPEKPENGLCWNSLAYKEFTRKQILEMKRKGYPAVYPQWHALHEALEYAGYEDWEMEMLLNKLYERIQYGDGMKSLVEEFEGAEDWLEPEDLTVLEHALCRCWAETGLPRLKGYSRQEIAERTGESLFTVASNDGYVLPGYTEKHPDKASEAGGSGSAEPKTDPNAFCPCGSGKRYRQCCGRKKK